MSFIDNIISFGSNVLNFFGNNSIGSQLAKTALLGYGLNQITKSINRDNEQSTQGTPAGTRIQFRPDTENKIPVVYGNAFLSGMVVDAVLTNSNQTMFYCLALCERTGVKQSDSQQSVITVKDVYWNDERIQFKTDGITVDFTVDRTGIQNPNPSGLVKIYLYNNGSTGPIVPEAYTNASLSPAYSIMPNWTSNHAMSQLVFAIIRIDYNKEKNITGLPKIDFHLSNTMTLPGDCMYDLMTNPRYGAGIDSSEISIS